MQSEDKFITTRCPLCRKILTETGASTEGHVRSECRGCRSLITIFCRVGNQPTVIDIRNKIIKAHSANP